MADSPAPPAGAVRSQLSHSAGLKPGQQQFTFVDLSNIAEVERDAWLIRERYRRAMAETLEGDRRVEWLESAARCGAQARAFAKLIWMVERCSDPVIKARLGVLAKAEAEAAAAQDMASDGEVRE
ncbi:MULTISPECIES: hypothetical protein [unclassified Bradyrhizobium]|uniref:hypothetical protein n=1 Tax=unclassified Bradyrhizobium TaxID=2631580 RepID=UPI0028F06D4F|nr:MULTISPECIES: hypothetical protein [unclassified Bradyrhizobium]